MNEPKTRGLQFAHGRLALAALAALLFVMLGLGWWDARRKQAEVDQLELRVCGELPSELQRALSELRSEMTQSDAAGDVLALWTAWLREPAGEYTSTRVVFKTTSGWREQQAHETDLARSEQPELPGLKPGSSCVVLVDEGQLHGGRALTTQAGVDVVLFFSRHRE